MNTLYFFRSSWFIVMILMLLPPTIVSSQTLQFSRPSPNATITQTIGMSEVSITYSRPGVKGRVIWGELVPYDSVWRTGANEATSISFSDTVNVEGQLLPAGTYSLATIPSQNEWTIIFNKNKDLWGAMGYKQEEDELRVKVMSQPAEHEERMSFNITDLTDSTATVELRWEKLKIPFKLKFATHALALAKARRAIDWRTSMNAANYCLTNDFNYGEATKWINLSLSIEENYWNMRTKARLLEKTGKRKDAIQLMEKVVTKGKEMKDSPFDFDQMQKLLADWKGKK